MGHQRSWWHGQCAADCSELLCACGSSSSMWLWRGVKAKPQVWHGVVCVSVPRDFWKLAHGWVEAADGFHSNFVVLEFFK